tara:strand:+ start:820 stop:2013 length:1194 start_codon:yes stop_codon:yes gene_type:complete
MALGAKLKVTMDSSDVSSGLSKMRSNVSSAFGTIKKIGVAAFGAISAAAAGLAAAAVNASKFARSVEVMSLQTGLSIKEVLALRAALERVGIEGDSTGDFISEFTKRLAEASQGEGEAIKGLEVLKISLEEIEKLSTAEALERVITAIRQVGLGTREANLAMDKLFGGQGMRLVAMASDFRRILQEARQDTSGLAAQFGDTEKFAKFERSLIKINALTREAQMRLVNALPLDKFDEALNSTKLDGFFNKLEQELSEFAEKPQAKLTEWATKTGVLIGRGIVEGIIGFITSGEGLKFAVKESLRIPMGLVPGGKLGHEKLFEGVDSFFDKDKTPKVEVEGKGLRFNQKLFDDVMRFISDPTGSKQNGKSVSLQQDLLNESKESNMLLRRLESATPSFA